MPLIERDRILNRFGGLLGSSTKVDIAVAWAGQGSAVDRLLLHARRARIRIAVGLSGTATDPETLHRLMEAENVELRIASPPQGGSFHPKFYRFRGTDGAVCWIGSANLTQSGFGGNAELVYEFRDSSGVGGEWFERLWNNLDEDPEPEIARYKTRYTEPNTTGDRGGGRTSRCRLPRLEHIETWGEFVDGLHVLNDYCRDRQFGWDVIGGTHSYLHTIRVGREIARRENWQNLSVQECNILLGLEQNGTGAWGLLGSLRGAGTVVSAFKTPRQSKVRSNVLEWIQTVVATEEAGGMVQAAKVAVNVIAGWHRFGPATPTRLLALACPGRLVSVNSMSAPGLMKFAKQLGVFANVAPDRGKPADHLARNYDTLLKLVHEREWCHAREPVNPRDREIWRCRAALVDAFVYIPVFESRARMGTASRQNRRS